MKYLRCNQNEIFGILLRFLLSEMSAYAKIEKGSLWFSLFPKSIILVYNLEYLSIYCQSERECQISIFVIRKKAINSFYFTPNSTGIQKILYRIILLFSSQIILKKMTLKELISSSQEHLMETLPMVSKRILQVSDTMFKYVEYWPLSM